MGGDDAAGGAEKAGLTLLQKLKLYNGKSIPNFTEDSVRELKEEAPAKDCKASARGTFRTNSQLSGFRSGDSGEVHQPVHGDERTGVRPVASQPDHRRGDAGRLPRVAGDGSRRVRGRAQIRGATGHQRADEDAITRLCGNYIENVRAYTQHEKVRNRYTGATRSRTSG